MSLKTELAETAQRVRDEKQQREEAEQAQKSRARCLEAIDGLEAKVRAAAAEGNHRYPALQHLERGEYERGRTSQFPGFGIPCYVPTNALRPLLDWCQERELGHEVSSSGEVMVFWVTW